MQADADAHKLGLQMGGEVTVSQAVAQAHASLRQYCGHSFEAATALVVRGGETLAVQINDAVTDALHVGAAGVRRALAPLLDEFERSHAVAPSAAATEAAPPASEPADQSTAPVEPSNP